MASSSSSLTEFKLAHGERIFVASTGAKDVVSIQGSVLGGLSSLAPTKGEVPLMAAQLYDAGTKKRGKNAIREALAERGASLSFAVGIDRTSFFGSCFPEDISLVLSTVFECLAGADFPPAEVANAKKRTLGELTESLTDTSTQSSAALMRSVYAPGHVNYAETTKTRMKQVAAVTRADLLAFRSKIGRNGLVLAITGDVAPRSVRKTVEKALAQLPLRTTEFPSGMRPNKKPHVSSEEFIPIADKANVDVYFGAAVPFTYDSPDYLAFAVAIDLLGGSSFSTHLMRTVRERDGHTYGIYAYPCGFAKDTEGMVRIRAAFSPAGYKKAIAATRKELAVFNKSGITEELLAAKKSQLKGSYKVGLSTSRGLAGMLHKIGTEGKPLSYINDYPELIQGLTVADLKKALAQVPLTTLRLAAAGTFTKPSS